MNIEQFKLYKNKRKISMVTCYDFTSATIVQQSNIDSILVGDSMGMVMQGGSDTLSVQRRELCMATQAVKRGAPQKFIVTDLPFLSTRKGLYHTMHTIHQVMQAGAQAIKIEGIDGQEKLFKHIIDSGIPIMGHLGLTPQSINRLGGHKVQGRGDAAQHIVEQALRAEDCGIFALVLECVPRKLASTISKRLAIPTIGIGAGSACDGQVLVWQDLLGLNDHNFTFLRKFLKGKELFRDALNSYHQAVVQGNFPNEQESFE